MNKMRVVGNALIISVTMLLPGRFFDMSVDMLRLAFITSSTDIHGLLLHAVVTISLFARWYRILFGCVSTSSSLSYATSHCLLDSFFHTTLSTEYRQLLQESPFLTSSTSTSVLASLNSYRVFPASFLNLSLTSSPSAPSLPRTHSASAYRFF